MIDRLKVWLLSLLSACNGIILRISHPATTAVEVIGVIKWATKIVLFDAVTIENAFDSHSIRFTEAGLKPYNFDQYRFLILQKDRGRGNKVDLAAIQRNLIYEIDTIRLLEVKGII